MRREFGLFENELLSLYPQYRSIWIEYSNYKGFHVVVTLFEQNNGGYHMRFGKMHEITMVNLVKLIDN